MPDNQTQKPNTMITNHALPNIWVDNIEVALREDGVCLLRFSTNLPEGTVEQSRILISRALLKNFIKDTTKTIKKHEKTTQNTEEKHLNKNS